MKNLYILFLTCLLCCSSNIKKTDKPTLDNFSFIINDGANDSYDSKLGVFTRHYIGGKQKFEVQLDKEELRSIYNLFHFYGFLDMPSEFVVDFDSEEVITVTIPQFYTSLKYCNKDTCCSVVLDLSDINNPINNKTKAFDYKKLYEHIWELIKQKEEFTTIPESDFYYM